MRVNVVARGMSVVGAVMLLAGCGQDQKLQETQQQLTTATNELAAARAEAVEVKTQMQTKVDDLQQNISKLTQEKTDTEKQMESLKTDLEQKLQEQQSKVHSLETDKANLTADKANLTTDVKSLNDQIADVNQKLAELTTTHAQTISHLQAMREEYVKLTAEKAALEAKLHDLKVLKEQITVVKLELHQKKVEELRRLDRAEFAVGNHGYLLKDGSSPSNTRGAVAPLNQDLYRVQ